MIWLSERLPLVNTMGCLVGRETMGINKHILDLASLENDGRTVGMHVKDKHKKREN